MKKNTLTRIIDVLSYLGLLTSIIGLAIGIYLLADIHKEWIVGTVTIMTGLVSGFSSKFITKNIRKLSHSRRIFLSYSNEDRIIVNEIAVSIRNTGAKVWLDKDRIKAGQNLYQEISNAIDEADRVVVFISRKASPNVMLEVGIAQAKGKKIIPVVLEAGPVPTDISNLKYIDLSIDKEGGIKELVDATT